MFADDLQMLNGKNKCFNIDHSNGLTATYKNQYIAINDVLTVALPFHELSTLQLFNLAGDLQKALFLEPQGTLLHQNLPKLPLLKPYLRTTSCLIHCLINCLPKALKQNVFCSVLVLPFAAKSNHSRSGFAVLHLYHQRLGLAIRSISHCHSSNCAIAYLVFYDYMHTRINVHTNTCTHVRTSK